MALWTVSGVTLVASNSPIVILSLDYIGIHMRIRCLTQSMWKVQNGEALEVLARRHHAVLHLSVRRSVNGVNRLGDDAQVVSCHRYLVIFILLLSS